MSITRDQVSAYISEPMSNEQISALIDQYIDPEPHGFSVANARLREMGASVAAIIADLEALDGDVEKAAEDFGASVDGVLAAVFFYWQYQHVIDAEITVRRSAFMD